MTLEHCIVGALRIAGEAEVTLDDCIVDAGSPGKAAYEGIASAPGDLAPGATLTVVECTIVGKVHAQILRMVSNSLLFSRTVVGDGWRGPVWAERTQEGCVRFTWLPPASIVPQRFQCHPAAGEESVAPHFSSRRYGTPAYCQLARSTPAEVRTGADDGSEMGVLHHLYGAQREANLRIRLGEYLRVGLSAGTFLES